MKISFDQISNDALATRLESLAARDRGTTVELLAHIAEFDRRRLYAPAGYSSMHIYCVDRLRMSDQVAFARIRTARACRRFPGILAAIEDGRLNVSGVVLLSAHLKLLTREAGRELLRAAVNKRQREIRLLLAERFPQPDTPTMLVPIAPVPSAPSFRQLCSNIVAGNGGGAETPSSMSEPVALAASTAPMPVQVGITDTHPVTPLAPGRLALHTTVDLETEDLVREAHELLGHPTATSHVPEVLKAAMQLYVAQLRKQKFADTDKPRTSGARSEDSRHIPAGVRREVWKRDQGQCTYVSPSGHRCQERCGLQYDHIVPYAQGGAATAGNVRLLCQTHNQLEAERTYGAGFMEHKREQAREQARERRKAG